MVTSRLHTLFTVGVLSFAAHLSAAEDPRDFSGVWQAFAATPPFAPDAIPELNPEGEVLVADFRARYPNPVAPAAYCVPAGMPQMMTAPAGLIEVVQNFNRVTVLDTSGQVRRIFIDARDFPEEAYATSAGYSIGGWERDTLVVETQGLDLLPTGRWPRSANTTINERITKLRRAQVTAGADASVASPLRDDYVLEVALTLTDTTLYRKPQALTVYYQHVDSEALPPSTCNEELWRQALDEANP